MTEYSKIFSSFLTILQDYNLDEIYDDSTEEEFGEYLTPFLIMAITKFNNDCTQDLSDRDDDEQYFNITLTDNEIRVLVEWMVVFWSQLQVNDIRSMELHIQDGDFKTYAESKNLEAKEKLFLDYSEIAGYSTNTHGWHTFGFNLEDIGW